MMVGVVFLTKRGAPRLRTGNLGRGLALIVRSLCWPRLLTALAAAMLPSIPASTCARWRGGKGQDRACQR